MVPDLTTSEIRSPDAASDERDGAKDTNHPVLTHAISVNSALGAGGNSLVERKYMV